MKVIRTISELRSELKKRPFDALVGFVPTMGFLHAGHASLLHKAREECQIVVLSIFVNPTQFGPNEDFDKYPRNEERDLAIAKEAGADIVFFPQVEEIYPRPSKTEVIVSDITTKLCGASRPGHFAGVTLVVSKLFNIVQPDKAYFGMKDAQQVAVITQMVNDLNMPVEIVPCPILREEDGLAMSSRNVYLSSEQRNEALVLSRTLMETKQWLITDAPNLVSDIRERITNQISASPLAEIDYVEVLSYPALETVERLDDQESESLIIALAVKFGATRLIDNVIISIKGN
ncbi:pantoate--beta-alanine ligase [Paenibacillus sp. N1-5-1-14]|uniref:pantoate--beta-alanine ligase n=1 Tax=Paenibacillus radicibacter TaxID=2972488 RepID=UPI0021597597|nr:pantoate--beta-alanine ligase [Paenibacillus radicibacter]MCR8642249.1 pantoate--beta-alanine ligase [Paenibacillus radicibacter]